MPFFWTIATLVFALGITWRYLGSYMAAVFDGRVHFHLPILDAQDPELSMRDAPSFREAHDDVVVVAP